MIRLRNIYLYAPNQSRNVNKRMLFFSNVTRIIAGISGFWGAIQLLGAALFFSQTSLLPGSLFAAWSVQAD